MKDATIPPPAQIVPMHPGHLIASHQATEEDKRVFITTQQLYDAVFENAFHPMYISDGREKMIRFNDKLLRLFGFSADEMRQAKPVDFFETYRQEFAAFVNRRSRKGIASAEVTCIRKWGERFPCRISSVLYETEKGEKRSMNTLVDLSKDIATRWSIFG